MSSRILALTALVSLAFGSSSCAIIGFQEGHEDGSASLGQAAEAAADSAKKKREKPPLDVGYTTPPAMSGGVEISGAGTDENLAPSEQARVKHAQPTSRPIFGFCADVGAFGGHDYDGFGGPGLSIGGYASPRVRVDLTGRAGDVNFSGQRVLGRAFKDAVDLKLDLMVRYELTREHTFMSFYPVVGIGTGTLFWDYAAPVPVVENGVSRMVKDDRINHFYGYAGVGASLMRTRHVLLDGMLTGGGRFYGWHTSNGFSNDILPPVGFAQFQVGIGFR